MADDRTIEIRYECPASEMVILDGYCQATGKSRSQVLRRLVAEFAAAKVHEATVLCRVARINPLEPDGPRK